MAEARRAAQDHLLRLLRAARASAVVLVREIVAARRRRVAEAEAAARTRSEEAEHRRALIDAAITQGHDPYAIARRVGEGVTEAQVGVRMLELARLTENRGKSWAELALDREIARLVRSGVPRDAIKHGLGVGASRITRVRRGTGEGR